MRLGAQFFFKCRPLAADIQGLTSDDMNMFVCSPESWYPDGVLAKSVEFWLFVALQKKEQHT